MTKNQSLSKELYSGIMHKETISEEFLYNSICFFEIEPEKVVEMLNNLSEGDCRSLDKAFSDARIEVKKMLSDILSAGDFAEPFHNPEIEDTIFYQMTHGYPVG